MKDAAIKSKSSLHPAIKSCISFSFNDGRFTCVPGRLILFLFPSIPPFRTSHTTSLSFISFTCNSIFPSSINICVPTFISLYNSL